MQSDEVSICHFLMFTTFGIAEVMSSPSMEFANDVTAT